MKKKEWFKGSILGYQLSRQENHIVQVLMEWEKGGLKETLISSRWKQV
jgi:hypothetical protein